MPNLWSDKLNNLIEAGHTVENDYDPHESIIKILENETVYLKSDMSADADGSPRATEIDPGNGQLETSLRKSNGWRGEGDNVNAEEIPYFVLPGNFKAVTNISCKLGDVALVRYKDREVFAIYADSGPNKLLGEGSIKLIESLGGNPWNEARTRIISGIGFGVEYLVFPRSSETYGIPTTFDEIQTVGRNIFDANFGDGNVAETAQPAANGNRSDVFLRLAEEAGQSVPAQRLIDYKLANHPAGNPRYWAIVDFNQPSTDERFYLFDTKEEKTTRYLVAHGHGNGDATDAQNRLYANVFSNVKGSNCSSLGIYKCLAPIESKHHGNALQIDGLENTNSNAKARSVILHKADYVSAKYLETHNYLGRSEGCFAVENSAVDTLISQLEKGSFIIAWKNPD
jgi:hypothetical protein